MEIGNEANKKNWKKTVLEDLKKLNMDWDTAENMANVRWALPSCVAQCAAGLRLQIKLMAWTTFEVEHGTFMQEAVVSRI